MSNKLVLIFYTISFSVIISSADPGTEDTTGVIPMDADEVGERCFFFSRRPQVDPVRLYQELREKDREELQESAAKIDAIIRARKRREEEERDRKEREEREDRDRRERADREERERRAREIREKEAKEEEARQQEKKEKEIKERVTKEEETRERVLREREIKIRENRERIAKENDAAKRKAREEAERQHHEEAKRKRKERWIRKNEIPEDTSRKRKIYDPNSLEQYITKDTSVEEVTADPNFSGEYTTEETFVERVTIVPNFSGPYTTEETSVERVTIDPNFSGQYTTEETSVERVTIDPNFSGQFTLLPMLVKKPDVHQITSLITTKETHSKNTVELIKESERLTNNIVEKINDPRMTDLMDRVIQMQQSLTQQMQRQTNQNEALSQLINQVQNQLNSYSQKTLNQINFYQLSKNNIPQNLEINNNFPEGYFDGPHWDHPRNNNPESEQSPSGQSSYTFNTNKESISTNSNNNFPEGYPLWDQQRNNNPESKQSPSGQFSNTFNTNGESVSKKCKTSEVNELVSEKQKITSEPLAHSLLLDKLDPTKSAQKRVQKTSVETQTSIATPPTCPEKLTDILSRINYTRKFINQELQKPTPFLQELNRQDTNRRSIQELLDNHISKEAQFVLQQITNQRHQYDSSRPPKNLVLQPPNGRFSNQKIEQQTKEIDSKTPIFETTYLSCVTLLSNQLLENEELLRRLVESRNELSTSTR